MILISAAGSGGTNRIIEGVDKTLFVGVTNDKHKLFCSVLEHNYLIPPASDELAYIEAINRVAKKHNCTLFIPNSDAEVYTATKHQDKLEVKTFLPTFEFVDICYDKLKLHQKMQHLSISSAKTFPIQKQSDIAKAFSALHTPPLWCRTRSGSGSRHTSKVYSIDDAQAFIQHTQKVTSLPLEEFLISEYLGGEDMAVVTLWSKGKMQACKMAKRTRYARGAGESPPIVIESFYSKEVEQFVNDAIGKLTSNQNGVLNVDIKCYADGTLAITEINPGRFYYNMTLFNYGKLNIFAAFLDLAQNKKVECFSDDPQMIFIREQDNCPTLISRKEFEAL